MAKTKNKKTKKRKTTAIVKVKAYELSKPDQMVQAAKQIKAYIILNNLSVKIVDKDYVMVEGWQFAGSLMGLYPKVAEVKDLGNNKWLAEVEIINRKTNEVVSTGFALCSKAESKKASFDEYAILSMAQTRAIGKAFRNLIGWVIKLAGYEPTPSEEMKGKPAEAIAVGDKAGGLMAGENEKEKIKILAKGLGLDTTAKIEKATGLKVDFRIMTKNQVSRVYSELLQIKISKK